MAITKSNMKLSWSVVDKFKDDFPGKHMISICEDKNGKAIDLPSPSDFVGTGGCFDNALENYLDKLNAYIDILSEFRDEVISTSQCYDRVVKVDYMDKTIKETRRG